MEENALKKFTTAKFISFAIGFFGLQFAWQMRIILSGPVTEELGASPFIFGLISEEKTFMFLNCSTGPIITAPKRPWSVLVRKQKNWQQGLAASVLKKLLRWKLTLQKC